MLYALLFDAVRDSGDDGARRRGAEKIPSGEVGYGARDIANAVSRDSADDRSIVARLRLGEPAALETLMLRYTDRMGRLATHLLGSRDAAEDVVQDVFVRVWDRRESLQIERSIHAYLLTAVRHRALNDRKYARVRERHRDAVLQAVEHEASAGHSVADRSSNLEAKVDAVLATLPERHQTAIRLRFVEQMAVPAIADVLGITSNATHQLIFRALATLRRALGLPELPR